MLISTERKFLFVHIPRTGGNSIRRALKEHVDGAVIQKSGVQRLQKIVSDRLSSGAKNRLSGVLQPTPLRYLVTTAGHPSAALLRLTNRDLASYKKFSFVRDPYDRLVSGYRSAAISGAPINEDFPRSFEEYLRDWKRYCQPQVNFVTFRGRILVDFIGRYESIQEDFDYVCNWIGVQRCGLPVLSESPGKNSDLLTPKTKRWVEETFADDFAAFNYPIR
jgi:hypothetical protein